MSLLFTPGGQSIGWNFSFRFSPSNEYSRLISFRVDWFNLLAIQETLRSLLQHTSSATQCLILCDPKDCSMPGLPVHHQLPKLAQTHVHRAGDAIQPSHPLSSPSPPALNLSQHQVFSSESGLPIRWPKYWSFSFSISPSNEYSGLISFRMDWLDLFAVHGTLERVECK